MPYDHNQNKNKNKCYFWCWLNWYQPSFVWNIITSIECVFVLEFWMKATVMQLNFNFNLIMKLSSGARKTNTKPVMVTESANKYEIVFWSFHYTGKLNHFRFVRLPMKFVVISFCHSYCFYFDGICIWYLFTLKSLFVHRFLLESIQANKSTKDVKVSTGDDSNGPLWVRTHIPHWWMSGGSTNARIRHEKGKN